MRIDEQVDGVSTYEVANSANIADLANLHRPDMPNMSVMLTENDSKAGEEFCRKTVDAILNLHLPKHIQRRPEIMAVIRMQQSFEDFTLRAMFAVVSQAIQMLKQLTVQDDIYTPEGLIDPFKIQMVLATQQSVMQLIAQFNMHVRSLPSVIINMIRDIEYSTAIPAEIVKDADSGKRSSKPMAVLLKEAEQQLQAKTVEVPVAPIASTEATVTDDVDYGDGDIEL